ncbi:MAG: twin-arginine translocase subunit TatB [Alphaproteobacteria bacterium]|nr:twin-arginine translocase subunit TatB [Alphaproteobacteria bacterium]
MFDLSWTEILLIGTAAIIFIGPKELPNALRTLGQWAGKARSLAGEFRGSVDDMIRESEIHKIKGEVDRLGSGDLTRQIEQSIDPKGELNKAFAPPEFSLDAPPPPAPAVSAENGAAIAPAEAAPSVPPPKPA